MHISIFRTIWAETRTVRTSHFPNCLAAWAQQTFDHKCACVHVRLLAQQLWKETFRSCTWEMLIRARSRPTENTHNQHVHRSYSCQLWNFSCSWKFLRCPPKMPPCSFNYGTFIYIYFFYFAVFTKTTVCACYALVSRLDAFVNERWYSPFHIPGRSGNRSRCVWGSPVLEADTHKETVLDIWDYSEGTSYE